MRIECAPNFRDLGGLPAADGRRIAAGLVFRSERVHPLAESGDAAALSGVKEEYLDESFAVIEDEYGGVDSYLEQASGLTPERRQQLQAVLLTP